MNTTLHVTIDQQTKRQAQKLAKEMGLDLSSIVKASLKTFVDTRVFHVEATPHMTPYLEKIIVQARKDLAAGKAHGPFHSGKELEKFLMK